MNAPAFQMEQIAIPEEFRSCFDRQRAAYLAAPEPGYEQRRADLAALARLLKENRDELVAAINADYGNRSEFETLFAEYFVVLESIADAAKHLKKWMKPQRRHIDFMTYPLARNKVIPQPLGVVGVIVPWNFPLNLSFAPLADALLSLVAPDWLRDFTEEESRELFDAFFLDGGAAAAEEKKSRQEKKEKEPEIVNLLDDTTSDDDDDDFV